MSFGGGGSSYTPPPPAPKVQSPKPVTEAATAARAQQRDKAARAAGITGAVHTSGALAANDPRAKTLLGR